MTARKPLTAKRLVGVCLGLLVLLAVCVLLGASVGTGDASLLRLLPGARALVVRDAALFTTVTMLRPREVSCELQSTA